MTSNTTCSKFIVAFVVSLFLSAAPQSAAAAPAAPAVSSGTCVDKTSAAFADVASDFKSLRPSIRKELSVFGLHAQRTGCVASVVCVSADATAAATKAARAQCSVVTRALVLTQLRSVAKATQGGRSKSATIDKTSAELARAGIAKTIVRPGGGRAAGMVYVSLN